VLEQLPYEPSFRGHVTIEPVAWDKKGAGTPILANVTPQDSIRAGLPKPSDCDIVVVIFWGRMGTPLPDSYVKPDGSHYLSGTEWEFEDALEASKQKDRPKILLYHRTGNILLNPDDPQFEEKTEQYRRVKAFFESLTNPDGSIRHGANAYSSPSEFKESLQHHLKSLIVSFLAEFDTTGGAKGIALPKPWPKSPFPGLRAFTADDAPIFFGRERETDALVKKVEDNSVVAVVGASGSGKSSLVAAGLIPRLLLTSSNEGWLPVTATPDYLGNGDPFAALSAAILRDVPPRFHQKGLADKLIKDIHSLSTILSDAVTDRGKALLFIDQFEELFTTVTQRFRAAYVETIINASKSDKIRVVITIRADFYGRCVELPTLADVLEDSTYPLSVPGIAALFEMINRPASRALLDFDEGLAQRILDDTGDEPGSLALMAYTLDELYRLSKRTRVLSHKAYDKIGGVQGAIGKRSELIFARLKAPEQAALASVFRELVEVDDRGTATRVRAPLSRVATTKESQRLVTALTGARLLVQNKGEDNVPFVEVAHEALFRSWERLAQWIADTQDDLRLLRQVRIAASEWNLNERREDYLWSQERLEPVYRMRDRLDISFDQIVEDFVRPEVDRLLEEFKANTKYFRQRPIIERYAEIGHSAVDSLVACLPHAKVKSSKKDIHVVLQKHKRQALPQLMRSLESSDAETRAAVIEEIGRMKDPLTVKTLVQFTHDENWRVRINASIALGDSGDRRAMKALARLFTDSNRSVSKVALIELTSFGIPEVLDSLIQAVEGDDVKTKLLAIQLVGLLASEETNHYYNFWEINKHTPLPYGNDLFHPLEAALSRACGMLAGKLTPRVIRAVAECLNLEDKRLRQVTAETLGRIGSPLGIKALGTLLDDEDSDVRSNALIALSKIKDKAVINLLIKALSSRHDQARVLAAKLLGSVGDRTASGVQAGLLSDHVHKTAARSLLIAALESENIDLRRAAATALGQIGVREAVSPLMKLMQDKDSELRANVVESLGNLKDSSTTYAIVEALRDGAADVRTNAVTALVKLGDRTVLPELLALERVTGKSGEYRLKTLRLALIKAFGELGDDSVVPLLSEAIRDSDWAFRQAAASALRQLKSPTRDG
jgi:HEAT repeat protein